MKTNKNYEFLLENGFDVDIRSSDNGIARMYLLKNGERVKPNIYTPFRDNKQSRDKLQQRVSKARDFTHLGIALKRMKETVLENFKLRK